MRAHFRLHPEWFFRHWLGVELYDKQIEICQSIIRNRTTSVASCNSGGKTGTAGGIVPWFLLSWDESIVVTTAPKWQQVKDLLWREINTRWEKATYPLSSQKPNVVSWELASNWYAVGVASKDPNKIQGYHADSGHLLVIVDEAAALEEALFEGIDAIMTSADCRLLMLGNPTSQSGSFRDSFKPNSNAHRIRIDMFDTPNFRENNIVNEESLVEAVKSGRELLMPYRSLVSPIWGYEKLKKWGPNSPLYQARCRARFPEVGETNLIPLNQIEAACSNERLDRILGLSMSYGDDDQERANEKIRQDALAAYIATQDTLRGVDVARFGSDATVITPRWGKVIGRQTSYHKEDTMQTAGRVWPLIENRPTDFTGVDVIGVGSGVVDRLRELQAELRAQGRDHWAQISGVNVADRPTDLPEGLPNMHFANKRAELYWKLRGMFETGDIYLMPDEDGNPPEDLMDELCSIQYIYRGDKVFIEEKSDMKKRMNGKSPDRADSLMLTLARTKVTVWESQDEKPAEDDDDWEPASRVDPEHEEMFAGGFDNEF